MKAKVMLALESVRQAMWDEPGVCKIYHSFERYSARFKYQMSLYL